MQISKHMADKKWFLLILVTFFIMKVQGIFALVIASSFCCFCLPLLGLKWVKVDPLGPEFFFARETTNL
jgi:hypothetical protein